MGDLRKWLDIVEGVIPFTPSTSKSFYKGAAEILPFDFSKRKTKRNLSLKDYYYRANDGRIYTLDQYEDTYFVVDDNGNFIDKFTILDGSSPLGYMVDHGFVAEPV